MRSKINSYVALIRKSSRKVEELNEKKKLDYVINKAIESYYNSDEIKKLLEL